MLIGINLLREGLDLPEVSFVAILDADKEGFLRSTFHRADSGAGRAKHQRENNPLRRQNDRFHKKAIDESSRRRNKQLAYNKKHGTEPRSIKRDIREGITLYGEETEPAALLVVEEPVPAKGRTGRKGRAGAGHSIRELEKEMARAAAELEFEKAARLRDRILEMRGKKT